MDVFQLALTHTLHHEGVDSDHPADRGGVTKYGISIRFLRAEGHDVDGDGDVDEDDIHALTKDHAAAVYRRYFWDRNGLDKIGSGIISRKIFDIAVNAGSRAAWKIAQKAYNEARRKHYVSKPGPLTVDGVPGPATRAAFNNNAKLDYQIINELREQQKKFYAGIIIRDPTQKAFELGWLRRACY